MNYKSCALVVLFTPVAAAFAGDNSDISAPGLRAELTLHAVGAQIYECKADGAGNAAWTFREPIATLFEDGKTVGRHYAGPDGPNWELRDGSAVVGKVVGKAPGTSAGDIPLLKLEIISQRGEGQLSGMSVVQRIATQGGAAMGPCTTPAAYRIEPYSADYVFFKR